MLAILNDCFWKIQLSDNENNVKRSSKDQIVIL